MTVDGEPRNLDGIVQLPDGTLWLWDYCVHEVAGADLHDGHELVAGKRNRCAKREDDFADLRAQGRGHPFPEVDGILVTHLCARDDTLAQDYCESGAAPRRREAGEFWGGEVAR